MKRGHPFDLPPSSHMVRAVRRALELSDMLYSKAPRLFPTRSTGDQREVICTPSVARETPPSETGYILRHTYRTIALPHRVRTIEARLCWTTPSLGSTVPISTRRRCFDRLLHAQERMSAAILSLVQAEPSRQA